MYWNELAFLTEEILLVKTTVSNNVQIIELKQSPAIIIGNSALQAVKTSSVLITAYVSGLISAKQC